MNFEPGRHLGLIAQEVEKVIPQVVSADNDGYKAVGYASLIPLLIEAVKELQAEVQRLEQQIGAP